MIIFPHQNYTADTQFPTFYPLYLNNKNAFNKNTNLPYPSSWNPSTAAVIFCHHLINEQTSPHCGADASSFVIFNRLVSHSSRLPQLISYNIKYQVNATDKLKMFHFHVIFLGFSVAL